MEQSALSYAYRSSFTHSTRRRNGGAGTKFLLLPLSRPLVINKERDGNIPRNIPSSFSLIASAVILRKRPSVEKLSKHCSRRKANEKTVSFLAFFRVGNIRTVQEATRRRFGARSLKVKGSKLSKTNFYEWIFSRFIHGVV